MSYFVRYSNKRFDRIPFYEGMDEMQALEEAVKGGVKHIRIPALDEWNIELWVNENGKLLGFPYIGTTINSDGNEEEVYGSIVFTGYDEEGNIIPIASSYLESTIIPYYLTHCFEDLKNIYYDINFNTVKVV